MKQTNKTIKKIAETAGRLLPDKTYINLRYIITFHKRINWNDPKTYNEKIQWVKLYDRNPLYTTLVDKYEVRRYIKEKIGDEYLIPCLGVWDSFDDIDFSKLPKQFVLKCTHDSGSVIVCRDQGSFDIGKAKKCLTDALSRNSYYGGREWAYKNVKPRIIAEKYMEDDSGTGLKDYKFFCFNGEVKCLFIATDRGVEGEDVKFDFFDRDFHHLPLMHGHKNADVTPNKPANFEIMIQIAEKLSSDFKHVRVDLYNVDGRVYFGEMTFYHHCGFVPFEPEEWDLVFGKWLSI